MAHVDVLDDAACASAGSVVITAKLLSAGEVPPETIVVDGITLRLSSVGRAIGVHGNDVYFDMHRHRAVKVS